MGYSPFGHKELDIMEKLSTHKSWLGLSRALIQEPFKNPPRVTTRVSLVSETGISDQVLEQKMLSYHLGY